MILASTSYGGLSGLVSAAGSLIAAAGAITLSWKGRARWEPSEEDVPRAAQKVAGLLIAVLIVAIWYWLRTPAQAVAVTRLAIASAIACVSLLLFYGLLVAVLTYESTYVSRDGQPTSRKIIGGFWVTGRARDECRKGRTLQETLRRASYDPDVVWPRLGRALAKLCFSLCYIGMVTGGSVSLAAGAILLSNVVP